jgi:hypothetical protein
VVTAHQAVIIQKSGKKKGRIRLKGVLEKWRVMLK